MDYGAGFRVEVLLCCFLGFKEAFGPLVTGNSYLSPKSMQNNSPKPRITAIKASILHPFGVQVAPKFYNSEPI